MRNLLLILTWFASFSAMSADLPASVSKALREAGIPRESVGVWVQALENPQSSAKPLIQFNASRAMNPASTMKLLTTSAALAVLGPAYTWHTDILTTGDQHGDVLEGDVILKGYGDPALTLERFWLLLHDLRQQGISEITGDLVLDSSVFDSASTDALDGQSERAYNTPPSALMVNFRAHNISFKTEAERVVITMDPALPAVNIVNQLHAGTGPCGEWKERINRDVARDREKVTVTLSGNYPRDCGTKSLELSLLDNNTYVAQLFTQLWRGMGGGFNGKVRTGTPSNGARVLAQSTSMSLAEVIRLINKNSNNVMARQVLLTLGYEKYTEKGSASAKPEMGAQVVRAWLAASGHEFSELVIENGAGLSRNERISSEHMGQLLTDQWGSSSMPEFIASLPITGVDGTMLKRLNGSDVSGKAHIKTGYLDGVRAIAGYVLDNSGNRWAVVFMVNHSKAINAKPAMDALLEWVYSRQGVGRETTGRPCCQ